MVNVDKISEEIYCSKSIKTLPFIFFYPSNRGLIFYDIDFFISFIIRLIIKVIPIFQTDVRLDVNDRKK